MFAFSKLVSLLPSFRKRLIFIYLRVCVYVCVFWPFVGGVSVMTVEARRRLCVLQSWTGGTKAGLTGGEAPDVGARKQN